MTPIDSEMLRRYIEDEAASLRSGKQGQFYPANHHILSPLIAKATRLLTTAERGALYFHLMRLGVFPKLASASELEIVEAAYDRVIPLLSVPHPSFRLDRTQGLFILGRDDRGAPLGPPVSLDEYMQNVATWRYLNSFAHMPGMLRKRPKFVELARNRMLLGRVRDVLMRVRLQDDLPGAYCLWFGSLVFIALQDDVLAVEVVAKITGGPLSEDLSPILPTLMRYLEASDRPTLASSIERTGSAL